MLLKNLALKNFRNISEAYLNLSPRLNLFIGDNGQGKTNFIEAIHFLIEGESFRYGDYSTVIQFGHKNSFIKSNILNNDLEYSVLFKIDDKKKDILINEKKNHQD